MDPARLRNLGLAAHIDAGKTTLTEAILVASGVERRAGRVDDGTTVMDFLNQERERGITISAAATRVLWDGYGLNLIDTPGHVDFTVEVERSMRVLDGAVLVVDARAGVQAQSERVFQQMRRHGLPAIAFVNKCDRVGADFLEALSSIEGRLGVRPLALQMPLGPEGEPTGCVDLVTGVPWSWSEGRALESATGAGADEASVLRHDLLEFLSEHDEAILEAFLEDREPPAEALWPVLRRLCLAGEVLPVFCGVALHGYGVRALLDGIVHLLPSPADGAAEAEVRGTGERRPVRADPGGSPLALVFKHQRGASGDRTFVRIYRGRLAPGMELEVARTGERVQLGRLERVHADHGEELLEAYAGDLLAAEGLGGLATGDTLGPPGGELLLESLDLPEPVIDLMIEPQDEGDRAALDLALHALATEDPSFRVKVSRHTGQWRVRGMGELHLEVAVERLRDEYRLAPRVGQPEVRYLERFVGSVLALGSASLVPGEREGRALVELGLEGTGGEGGPTVEWGPGLGEVGDVRVALEEGLEQACQSGPQHGSPLAGCRLTVAGLRSEGLEASQLPALAAQAARNALALALGDPKGQIELLEPHMEVVVEAPEEFAGGILADLGARQAEIAQVVSSGLRCTLRGSAPLAHLLGYASVVRSLSQGRATSTLRFGGFRAVSEAEQRSRGL